MDQEPQNGDRYPRHRVSSTKSIGQINQLWQQMPVSGATRPPTRTPASGPPDGREAPVSRARGDDDGEQ